MFEKQYKETFSQVVASDSLMQEVLNLKNKRRNKIRVMTLVAAAVTAVPVVRRRTARDRRPKVVERSEPA